MHATDFKARFCADAGDDAVTDNDTGADSAAVTETDARRILGSPLHQVDSQPLRCPLGPEEERKVSR